MAQSFNILAISLFAISCLCSCCRRLQEPAARSQKDPEWDVRLPLGSAASISTGSLIPSLTYDGVIVFPTTIRSYPDIEEHRLCGINTRTHKVEWIFPKDTTISYGLYFENSSSYQHDDTVVLKSVFDMFGGGDSESVLCFSMKDQNIIWSHKWLADLYANDCESNVYSDGKRCFAVINGQYVYAFDIDCGEKELVYDSGDYQINFGPIFVTPSRSCFIETKIREDYENYRYTTVDLTTGAILDSVPIPYDKKVRATVCNVILDDGTIYYTDDYHIAAINAVTGETIWSRIDEGYGCQEGLHLSDNILLKHDTQTYMALNAKDGEILYSNSSFGFGESVLHGKYLYSDDCEGHIIVMEYKTGEVLDTLKYPDSNYDSDLRYGGYFTHNPVVKDDKLYLIGRSYSDSKDYRVFCYSLYPWD